MNQNDSRVMGGFKRVSDLLEQQCAITRELLREKDERIQKLEAQLATARRRRQTKVQKTGTGSER